MNMAQRNIYGHLKNCSVQSCAWNCPYEVFRHGWNACARENEEALMDAVIGRASINPVEFILHAIAHLNNVLPLEDFDQEDPLWKAHRLHMTRTTW